MTFNGTAEEYLKGLYKHNEDCEVCAPNGLPNPNDGELCEVGNKIRLGLSLARGREAHRTGAKL